MELYCSLKNKRRKIIIEMLLCLWSTLQLREFEMWCLCLFFTNTLFHHSLMLKKRVDSNTQTLTNHDHLIIIIQNE